MINFKKHLILKDTVMILSFALLAMSFLISILMYSKYRDYTLKAEDLLEKNLIIVDNELQKTFDYVSNLMQFFGKQIISNNADDVRSIQKLLRSNLVENNKMRTQFSWAMFDWSTPDLKMRVSTSYGIIPEPIDIKHRHYAQMAGKEPWVLHFDTADVGITSGRWIIPAGMGITGENGKLKGILSLGFVIENLNANIQNAIRGGNNIFAIIDESNKVVLHSQPEPSYDNKKEALFNAAISREFPKVGSGKLLHAVKNGNLAYTHFVHMDNYPYTILLGYNEDDFVNQLINLTMPGVGFILVLGLLVSSALVIFRYVFILKPMVLLSKIANDINRGRLVSKMPRGGSYEVKQFTKLLIKTQRYINKYKRNVVALEKANQEVSQSQQKLLEHNKQLERVKKALQKEKEISQESKIARERLLSKLKQEIKQPLDALEGLVKVLINIETNAKNVETGIKTRYLESALLTIENIKNNTANHLVLSHVPVRKLIEDCIKIQQDDAKHNKIRIKKTIQRNIPDVYADELRLNQIITALIYRAIEDSPDTIVINANVATKQNNHFLNLSFEDNGVGLSEEERQNIFQKFGDAVVSRKTNGTDLALPAIEKLVTLHNGTLSIESTRGKGTKVIVTLPYLSAKETKTYDPETTTANYDNVINVDFLKH